MTRVRLSCPGCQAESSLPAAAVSVVVCDHGARYCWFCGVCARQVSKPAPPDILRLLTGAAGIQPLVVAEEPGGRGPTLTEDDLIDFGQQLEALG